MFYMAGFVPYYAALYNNIPQRSSKGKEVKRKHVSQPKWQIGKIKKKKVEIELKHPAGQRRGTAACRGGHQWLQGAVWSSVPRVGAQGWALQGREGCKEPSRARPLKASSTCGAAA